MELINHNTPSPATKMALLTGLALSPASKLLRRSASPSIVARRLSCSPASAAKQYKKTSSRSSQSRSASQQSSPLSRSNTPGKRGSSRMTRFSLLCSPNRNNKDQSICTSDTTLRIQDLETTNVADKSNSSVNSWRRRSRVGLKRVISGQDYCSEKLGVSQRTPPDGTEDVENIHPNVHHSIGRLGYMRQCQRGQLKLTISCSSGQLTVQVHEARHLRSKWTSQSSSFVEISLIPGDNRSVNRTATVDNCVNPRFEQKFSLEMSSDDQKRLKVALFNKEADSRESRAEALGCMTFGLKHLKTSEKEVNGWYYLLNEGLGQRKHLKVPEQKDNATKTTTLSSTTSSRTSKKSSSSIPDVNKSLQGLDNHTVVVKRGRHGYGFTVMGSSPVTIGKVEDGSQAQAAGLRKGDAVVRINGQNVSRSTCDSVAKIVKNSPKQIILDLVRTTQQFNNTKSTTSTGYESMPLGCDAQSLAYDTTSVDYDVCSLPRQPCTTPSSDYSLRSSSRRSPVGGTTPASMRRIDDSLPLCPSQVDNTTSCLSSVRRRKSPLSRLDCTENDENSVHSSRHHSRRSSRKSARKSAKTDSALNTTMNSESTTNGYDSLRWDGEDEEIFFPEQHGEIFDELPWKPFDCDLVKKKVTTQEDTYATMYDLEHGEAADMTYLEISMTEVDESRIKEADYAHTTLPEVSFCDLSRREKARQAAARQLLRAEADFIAQMQYGIQRFSRPLRHCILSAGEHRILFQNVEKLVAFSEYHMRQMADTSLAYADLTSADSDDRYVEVVGTVYRQRATILCEAYELYIQGLGESLRLLDDLRTYEQFHHFLATPKPEGSESTLEEFLRKPEEHLRTLMMTLRTVMSYTSSSHHDASALQRVVKTFSECCSKLAPSSSAKQTEDQTMNSSGNTTTTTSTSFASSRRSGSSSGSKSSTASIDSELIDIQDRLVFPKDIATFRLAVPSRHVIYTSELLRVESCMWERVVVILLSDLLLVTRVEGDSLVVVEDPLSLPDVNNFEFGGSHPCEFTLTAEVQCGDSLGWEVRHLLLRAPSMEQACTWKSLLEQRIASFRTHRELMAGRSREATL